MLRAHNQVVTSATDQNAGTVVEGWGDGFMLAFGSAQQALKCALAIQAGMSETFAGYPDRRSGLPYSASTPASHLPIADDFFGRAVDYDARWPLLRAPRRSSCPHSL